MAQAVHHPCSRDANLGIPPLFSVREGPNELVICATYRFHNHFDGVPPLVSYETMLPEPSPDVIFGTLSEGAVLFATGDEVYFGLNEVGVCVWELLPPARNTVEQVCEELERRYPDVPSGTIRQDVIELLADLAANGLVIPRQHKGLDAQGIAARGP